MFAQRSEKPAFRFYGSKWRIAQWIIDMFPCHDCYVEPFGGSAAVLLQKPRSPLEVFNDKDAEIINFFRILRERPEALIRAIQLTPYAKAEWELSFEESSDCLETARRFYIRAFMSIAGATAQWKTGWRRQKVISNSSWTRWGTSGPRRFMQTEHLFTIANRFRGVQIECDEAFAVIERYDTPKTLFYLDPPYPSCVRSCWNSHAYQYEMTDQDHRRLAMLLHDLRGMAIISGYDCDLYDELFGDWQSVRKETRTQSGMGVEVCWLSPHLARARLPLFALIN